MVLGYKTGRRDVITVRQIRLVGRWGPSAERKTVSKSVLVSESECLTFRLVGGGGKTNVGGE